MAKKKAQPARGQKKKFAKGAVRKSRIQPPTRKTAKKKPPKASRPGLGRPKVTGEENLDMLFHDDFHSRQVFKFLRVETVKELEQFTPKEIFKLLSKPMSDAVNSIRKRLAEKNRYLQDDIEFAAEYQTKNSPDS